MTWAALLLAAALLIRVDPGRFRLPGWPAASRRDHRQSGADRCDDPLAAASAFDVLAACLNSGMAVSAAAAAAAPSAPPALARLLERASSLLALGADPATAWSDATLPPDRNAEAMLRLARRSASSGAALADGVAELANQVRAEAANVAEATAERASVLVAGPLGLCYLPAFLCLGIVPVVAGLAGDVLRAGLL